MVSRARELPAGVSVLPAEQPNVPRSRLEVRRWGEAMDGELAPRQISQIGSFGEVAKVLGWNVPAPTALAHGVILVPWI